MNAAQPIVAVDDVHVSFGDVRALTGASLSIETGTVYGLLGANGAGKTTLINVLSTLLVPDSGTATVGGADVTREPQVVRRRIGLAGQFAAVDDYQTGRENVEMVGRLYGLSRRDARRRAGEVLARFQLTDAADRKAATYSGGMRRRLDLAASLVGRPECCSSTSRRRASTRPAGSTSGISSAIWSTVAPRLLTTQYLEEADELADLIGVIDHGSIITEGTADELKDGLGDNTVRLSVHDDDLEATRQALADLDSNERAGGRFDLAAIDGNRTVIDVLRRLDNQGVEPLELALERPTLDDVFLTLTGRTRTDAHEEAAS